MSLRREATSCDAARAFAARGACPRGPAAQQDVAKQQGELNQAKGDLAQARERYSTM
jgi:hypothetical protein